MDMRVNRRSRRFHDPWGNKRGNHGSVIRMQWLLGEADQYVNDHGYYIDKAKAIESSDARFVLGKKSVEKIRR